MKSRFEQFREILTSQNYFKLVCGAGNRDVNWIESLTFVYAMAGALGIDVAADGQVVKKAVSGLRRAEKYLYDHHRMKMSVMPFITVSVGMPGDHHVRKAIINDRCSACDACIPVCPTKAIPDRLVVIEDLCIGCGACEAACHFNSIQYSSVSHELEVLLPHLRSLGADNVELHAAVPGMDTFIEEWKTVCGSVPDNFVSLSIDRNHLSNYALLERIEVARSIAGERTMIQADGVPMGGTGGELSKTIQAIACAQQINLMVHFNQLRKKADRELMVLLSGGTNALTRRFALEAGVLFHGISIGTYALSQVEKFVAAPDFYENTSLINDAVMAANRLVTLSIAENSNIVSV